jgi:hypothetical protein
VAAETLKEYLAERDYIFPENMEIAAQAWEAATKAAEARFTSTNIARDEICPYRDTWTFIDSDGTVKYKVPACIRDGGQTSPVA